MSGLGADEVGEGGRWGQKLEGREEGGVEATS